MNIPSSGFRPQAAKAPAQAAQQTPPQEDAKPNNLDAFTGGFAGGAENAIGLAGGVSGFIGLGTVGAGIASGGAVLSNLGEIVSSISSGNIGEVGGTLLKTVASAGIYGIGGGLVGGTIGGVVGYKVGKWAGGVAGDFGAALTPKSVGNNLGRAAGTTALGIGLGIAGANIMGHGLTGAVALMGVAGGVYGVAKANG